MDKQKKEQLLYLVEMLRSLHQKFNSPELEARTDQYSVLFLALSDHWFARVEYCEGKRPGRWFDIVELCGPLYYPTLQQAASALEEKVHELIIV